MMEGFREKGIITVASRASRLALLQVGEFFKRFPSVGYTTLAMESYGDKHRNISLFHQPFGDFFTRELDEALISGHCDVAVHSAKDLPYPIDRRLKVVCLTDAGDSSDSLVSKNNTSLAALPAGSRVGTSSVVRRREILRLRPDLLIVSIRGTIEERIALIAGGEIDALIVATCALRRLGLEHLAAEKLPFPTHPLQGMLAVTARADDDRFDDVFSAHDVRRSYGKVTLAGFGPGDPDLITIAADEALREADIIFHDDLIDTGALYRYPGEKVYVGKRKGAHSHSQEKINELLYRAAIGGKKVVRLKGGDPMLFAHGREEIDYLRRRFVEVGVIPGISAALAASALTAIPLTHRGLSSSVAFVTAHSQSGIPDVEADTIVYYMGASKAKEITAKLISSGHSPDTPVALVSAVSLPGQRTFFSTLARLEASDEQYPTPLIIIVGKVVGFGDGQNFPRTVLATGTDPADLKDKGIVRHEPLISIGPAGDTGAINSAIDKLGLFDWLVFTSRYGVRYFFEALAARRKDIRSLSHLRIASVGPVTSAELAAKGVYPEHESQTGSARGIIDYFTRHDIRAVNILLPRSDKGLEALSAGLGRLGNKVHDVAFYTNTINPGASGAPYGEVDAIAFSSPSAVGAFREVYGLLPDDIPLMAKGGTTLKEIKINL